MDDDLAVQAYEGLYHRTPRERMRVAYHGNLKGYNATVQRSHSETVFRLAPGLERCEPEIKIGIIQYLLNRLNRTKEETDEIRLYHAFVKRMSEYAPVTESDPKLRTSFDRMNERFFHGMMTVPNLVWGRRSTTLLGTYAYATDTITISRALADAQDELLDSVMHHEMLHKKHKFSCSSGRTHSHTPSFRKDEALYPNVEAALQRFLRRARQQKSVRAEAPSFIQRVMGWR